MKEFYKHIHLDYAKLKFLSRIKKLIALPIYGLKFLFRIKKLIALLIYGHFCCTDQVIIFISFPHDVITNYYDVPMYS